MYDLDLTLKCSNGWFQRFFVVLNQVYFYKKRFPRWNWIHDFLWPWADRWVKIEFPVFKVTFLFYLWSMIDDLHWLVNHKWVQNRQKKTNALNSQVLKPIICPIFFGRWTFLERTWSLTWHPVPMSLILAPFQF